MERLDFASVMAVLRRNIPDENFGNQMDFLDSLFLDMGFSPQTAMEFDQGQVCRWINGLAKAGTAGAKAARQTPTGTSEKAAQTGL